MTKRYRLICWVTTDRDVCMTHDEGYATLSNIFQRKPGGVRWAVAHTFHDDPPYQAIDLFDLKWEKLPHASPMVVGLVLRFHDLDPAIMAAVTHP